MQIVKIRPEDEKRIVFVVIFTVVIKSYRVSTDRVALGIEFD